MARIISVLWLVPMDTRFATGSLLISVKVISGDSLPFNLETSPGVSMMRWEHECFVGFLGYPPTGLGPEDSDRLLPGVRRYFYVYGIVIAPRGVSDS